MVHNTTALRAAAEQLRAATEAEDAARKRVHEEVLKAIADGVPQVEIVAASGYTREHIRQLARKAREEGETPT